MTDSPKSPTLASFAPMMMTGVVSGSMGDQVGDAVAQILSWVVAVKCSCVPPDHVISAFHTLMVALTMIVAFSVHYAILKQKGE